VEDGSSALSLSASLINIIFRRLIEVWNAAARILVA
jgi:hypothetical protein